MKNIIKVKIFFPSIYDVFVFLENVWMFRVLVCRGDTQFISRTPPQLAGQILDHCGDIWLLVFSYCHKPRVEFQS